MYKVGLTGNYYSGQTEVAELFEDYNVPVFNANLVTKFLLNFSPKHIQKIKSEFGEGAYSVGLLNINRFSNNRDFNKIFDIVELDIMKSFELFRLKHKYEFYTIFHFDYLYERNLDKLMNFNVTCYRPAYQRKSDMEYLTNFPKPVIEKILSSEVEESIKNKKSDFIIHNYNRNGDYKSDIVIGLDAQVKNTHTRIMKKKMDSAILGHYPLDIDNIKLD